MNADDKDFRDSVTYMTKSCRTITISPPHQVWDEDKYLAMWADIKLNALVPCSGYIIIPEVADDGRLHFHGVIRFSCQGHRDTYFDKRFRYQRVLKKYGSIVHSPNSPKKQWIEYIWKDWAKTKELYPSIRPIRFDTAVTVPDNMRLGYYESDDEDEVKKPNEDQELIAQFQSELLDELGIK